MPLLDRNSVPLRCKELTRPLLLMVRLHVPSDILVVMPLTDIVTSPSAAIAPKEKRKADNDSSSLVISFNKKPRISRVIHPTKFVVYILFCNYFTCTPTALKVPAAVWMRMRPSLATLRATTFIASLTSLMPSGSSGSSGASSEA